MHRQAPSSQLRHWRYQRAGAASLPLLRGGVEEDRPGRRDRGHRLQPVPGQGAPRPLPDLLLGLGGDRGAGAPLDRALPSRVLRSLPALGEKREAARNVLLDPQVPGRRSGAARAAARGVEPAGAGARLCDGGAGGGAGDPRRGDLLPGGAVMGAYVVRRIAYGFLVVQGVLLFLFVLFFGAVTPEDMARRAIGEQAPPEAVAQWILNHGYHRPRLWNPEDPTDTLLF